MNLSKSYVLNAFMQTPWVITLSKLAVLEEIVARHVSGEKLSAEEIQARTQGMAPRPLERKVKTVAVLPLFGTIIPRADFFEEASGATSVEAFGKRFSQLINDPSVDAIVIDVNSPGGQAGGIPEVSQKIYDARGSKPIIAVANQMMASGAYWLATSADEVVVTPSGEVGSIGVYCVHQDVSAALDQEGVKLSIVSAGKYKVETNPWQPLTEEARAQLQTEVNYIYDNFVNAIARNRGVNADAVRNGFGEGRVVNAEEAVKLGMADRVATLEQVIGDLLDGNNSPAGNKASANELKPSGQAPALTSKDEARARLESAATKKSEGDTPMLRKLLNERDAKVTRAQAIVKAADDEERDLTEAERAEITQLLGEGEAHGEIGALDTQIEKISDERERLRTAASKKFNAVAGNVNEAQKPDGNTHANVLKRAEYDKLSQAEQAAFVKTGGTVTD